MEKKRCGQPHNTHSSSGIVDSRKEVRPESAGQRPAGLGLVCIGVRMRPNSHSLTLAPQVHFRQTEHPTRHRRWHKQ
ncbi:Hypothetical predicted protein, partial [Marmota monax]